MYLRELSCLFFHIPKAAGSAVERWLIGRDLDPGVPDFEHLFGWEQESDVNLQHANPAMVRQLIGEDELERCFRFAVVRNPYARVVSVYYYQQALFEKLYGDFAGYVRALPGLAFNTGPRTRQVEHHLPQVDYTRLDGQPCCHALARFEQLPHSLDPIARQLNIDRPLPFVNTNPRRVRRPVSSFYTRETAAIVAEVYAEDFDAFDYSTDPKAADEAGPGSWRRGIRALRRLPRMQTTQEDPPAQSQPSRPGALEREVLCLLCRPRFVEAEKSQLAASLDAGLDWHRLFSAALSEDVAPLVAHRLLHDCHKGLPGELREGLEIFYEGEILRARALAGELADLLGALAADDIPVVPIKGPKLALDLYGDMALRSSRDLDLLLREADLDAALACLHALGYRHQTGLDSRQLERVRRYGGQYILFHPERTAVEPHWEIAPRTMAFDLDYQGLWQRTRPGECVGVACRRLPPEEELLLLCLHGAKEKWQKLKWIADVAALLETRPDIDWSLLYRDAAQRGFSRMLELALILAEGLLNTPLPQAAVNQDPEARRLAERIAQGWAEAPDPYRLSWFYWRMRERPSDRWRSMLRTLLTPRAVHYGLVTLPKPLEAGYYPLKLLWDGLLVPANNVVKRIWLA